MRIRRSALSLLGLTLVAGVTMAFAQNVSPEKAKVGEKAPNFTLKDTAGKEHSLKDFEDKLVVLQWINYGCPVCRRVMETGVERDMIQALKKLDEDIVILAINSTRDLDAARTKSYLKDNKIDATAVLLDKDGTVGKLYGARTTPHLYVIDKEGVLRYNGAIDNGNARERGEMNYVVNAVKQILNGETVSPDTTRPYGCNVKYAN